MTDSARPRPSAAPLPIDAHLSRVVEAVERAGVAIVSAEPGAGKTTRVPVALLDAAKAGSVLVLEPRRIAARYSAERVAYERGSKLGDEVGFLTRFERAASGRTRLMFLTEGILSRRMLADPRLEGVSTVVLDEFHERHLPSDIGLALLARLRQTTRPDLRVVVMSATLDVEPLARFLAAPVVLSTGRAYPVSVEHAPRTDDRPLESRVASALFDLIGRGLDGHVLVFLPGAREIRACMQTAGKLAEKHDLELLPLHGALGPAEQNRALAPSARRKVVFATNVAETSVTIDGVAAVVDSGLANVASCSPWSGLPVLKLAKISKASAIQRAGRAGRTGPGTAIRLYTQGDFEARPAFEAPEIARTDLSEAVLELVAQGIADPRALAWLEAPPAAALDRASTLLDMLGAVTRAPDGALALTADGERMIHFNVHPRQARIVVEAERRGVAFEGAALAAVAQEQPSRRADPREHRTSERSDLFFMMDELERVMPGGSGRDGRGASRELMAAAKVRDQLRAALGRDKGARAAPRPPTPDAFDDALLISVLAGYPDRVGRVKRPDLRVGRKAAEVVFAAGGSALLDDASAVREAELIVAIDVEDRVSGAQSKTSVRVASEVKPDFLLELFLDRIEDEEVVTIAGEQGRVQATRVLRYQNLVLEEHPAKAPSPELAARALRAGRALQGPPPRGQRGDRAAARADRSGPRVHAGVRRGPVRSRRSHRRRRARGRERRVPLGAARHRLRRCAPLHPLGRAAAVAPNLDPREDLAAVRARGDGALRPRVTAEHRLAPAGLLRHDEGTDDPRRTAAPHPRAARPEPARRPDHDRPRRILEDALPRDRARAPAQVPAPRLARRSALRCPSRATRASRAGLLAVC